MQSTPDRGKDEGMSTSQPTATDALRTIIHPRPEVRGTLTVRELAKVMTDNQCSAVVVTKRDGTHAVATERDIVVALANDLDPDDDWAVDVMSVDLRTLHPDDPITEAARLMRDGVIRHVVVVDEETNALSIVSIRDLLSPFLASVEG